MKPLSLKDLPQYLKSLKEKNQTDEDLVVDMGKIVNDRPSLGIFKKFSLITVCLFLGTSIAITYNMVLNEKVTIVLNSDNRDMDEISKMVSENGAQVFSIEKNKNNDYEIKLKVRKNLKNFLENLRKNKNVKKVELEKN